MARYPQIERVVEHARRILRTRGYSARTEQTEHQNPWEQTFERAGFNSVSSGSRHYFSLVSVTARVR